MSEMVRHNLRSGALRKVCYHHLKKCGGTSLNAWLDAQFDQPPEPDNELEREARASVPRGIDPYMRERATRQAVADAFFGRRDLFHNHLGVVCHVPEGCFRFTVLREPRARLLSQIRDYRRLSEHHIAGTGPHAARAIRDAQAMRLRPFLEKYNQPGQPHGDLFNNYMVRAIAMNRVGLIGRETGDARKLLPVALDVLSQDMDFVGILEKGSANLQILASILDWMPDEVVPALNKTDQALLDPTEVAEAENLIAAMTAQDYALYEAGSEHFAETQRSLTTTPFAEGPLQRRLAALNASAGRPVYGMDLARPLTAVGHDGRHVIPDGRPCLYLSSKQSFRAIVQAPPNQTLDLTIQLGWRQSDHVISGMRLRVDDVEIALTTDEGARNLRGQLAPAVQGHREFRIDLPPYDAPDGRALQLFGITVEPVATTRP